MFRIVSSHDVSYLRANTHISETSKRISDVRLYFSHSCIPYGAIINSTLDTYQLRKYRGNIDAQNTNLVY